jgi:hypothetical protein
MSSSIEIISQSHKITSDFLKLHSILHNEKNTFHNKLIAFGYGNCINNGVNRFSIDGFITILHQFCLTYPELYIIVVGSGSALSEACYLIKYPENAYRFIFVDPNPMSFGAEGQQYTKPFLEPNYSTVRKLIKQKKQLIDNCIVLLNWCDPDNSTYDKESIDLLQPKAFLTLTESNIRNFKEPTNGSAGSAIMFQFLQEQKILDLNDADYRLVHDFVLLLNVAPPAGPFEYHFQWWESINIQTILSDDLIKYINSFFRKITKKEIIELNNYFTKLLIYKPWIK